MKVGLFRTCLVDGMRPSVGLAAEKLLSFAQCEVIQPKTQTCCGQPAWNSGYSDQTKCIAEKCIGDFADCDYVIIPSGSCGGMMRKHYPHFDAAEKSFSKFANKCYELTDFLGNVAKIQLPRSQNPQTLTYHDGCAGLRELSIKQQPRKLLTQCGHTIIEMPTAEECCGFGGTFSVKFGDISSALVADKCQHIVATQCDTVVMGDVGCMLNIEGKFQFNQSSTKVVHIAEILAETIS